MRSDGGGDAPEDLDAACQEVFSALCALGATSVPLELVSAGAEAFGEATRRFVAISPDARARRILSRMESLGLAKSRDAHHFALCAPAREGYRGADPLSDLQRLLAALATLEYDSLSHETRRGLLDRAFDLEDNSLGFAVLLERLAPDAGSIAERRCLLRGALAVREARQGRDHLELIPCLAELCKTGSETEDGTGREYGLRAVEILARAPREAATRVAESLKKDLIEAGEIALARRVSVQTQATAPFAESREARLEKEVEDLCLQATILMKDRDFSGALEAARRAERHAERLGVGKEAVYDVMAEVLRKDSSPERDTTEEAGRYKFKFLVEAGSILGLTPGQSADLVLQNFEMGPPLFRLAMCEGALELLETHRVTGGPLYRLALRACARYNAAVRRDGRALDRYRRLIAHTEGWFGKDSPELCDDLRSLGVAYGLFGNESESRRRLERAARIAENLGPDDWDVALKALGAFRASAPGAVPDWVAQSIERFEASSQEVG